MKQLLNDFISLIFGKKEYSNLELAASYGFLIFIVVVLFVVRERI